MGRNDLGCLDAMCQNAEKSTGISVWYRGPSVYGNRRAGGLPNNTAGYLSACVRSRQSLGPSLTQLPLYSHSNLKYSPLLIGAQHNLIIDLQSSSVPIFLRCFPGGVSLRAAGENGGALQHFYLGSPRWAMVGWFRPPGTGEPPILGLDETLF